jgi:hypothetical protein
MALENRECEESRMKSPYVCPSRQMKKGKQWFTQSRQSFRCWDWRQEYCLNRLVGKGFWALTADHLRSTGLK